MAYAAFFTVSGVHDLEPGVRTPTARQYQGHKCRTTKRQFTALRTT